MIENNGQENKVQVAKLPYESSNSTDGLIILSRSDNNANLNKIILLIIDLKTGLPKFNYQDVTPYGTSTGVIQQV